MVRWLVFIALASASCGDPDRKEEQGVAPGTVASVFSRSAVAAPHASASADPFAIVDLAARKTFLSDLPKAPAVLASTKLGTDTGLPASSSAPSVSNASVPVVPAVVGELESVRRSSSGIERILRASAYARLVERCRDDAGARLPAEAIELTFVLDESGRISPATITAKAKDAAHERAALCMIRELGAIDVRAPAATRGERTMVKTTVPSVD